MVTAAACTTTPACRSAAGHPCTIHCTSGSSLPTVPASVAIERCRLHHACTLSRASLPAVTSDERRSLALFSSPVKYYPALLMHRREARFRAPCGACKGFLWILQGLYAHTGHNVVCKCTKPPVKHARIFVWAYWRVCVKCTKDDSVRRPTCATCTAVPFSKCTVPGSRWKRAGLCSPGPAFPGAAGAAALAAAAAAGRCVSRVPSASRFTAAKHSRCGSAQSCSDASAADRERSTTAASS